VVLVVLASLVVSPVLVAPPPLVASVLTLLELAVAVVPFEFVPVLVAELVAALVAEFVAALVPVLGAVVPALLFVDEASSLDASSQALGNKLKVRSVENWRTVRNCIGLASHRITSETSHRLVAF